MRYNWYKDYTLHVSSFAVRDGMQERDRRFLERLLWLEPGMTTEDSDAATVARLHKKYRAPFIEAERREAASRAHNAKYGNDGS